MDRLADLRELAGTVADDEEPEEQNKDEVTVQVDGDKQADEEPSPFMSDFFDLVKRIIEDISTINQQIDILAVKHEQVIAEANSNKANEINKQLHEHMDNISAIANRIRRDLKAIEQENKRLGNQKTNVFEDGTVSTELRIRQSQHSTLSRKFVEVMTRYNDVQAQNKQKYSEAVRRLCYVCDPTMSEESVQVVLEHGTAGVFSGLRVRQKGARGER
ncbi:hypothetical protein PTSG_07526 [Salpingoeca rosetta]|uniref:Syntaxin N-terminal domain-containing protein n=1 Tax=Salpingoeca rosetta (strain ATCC 50818 / BSB-021) TaxID=946362 RepID=F2UH08_SALR5|nr:uncharacterized protein PTSG_07526 [Salpingoeca rosetta]EGD76407.1 hypothetical protein PTSG_07526 [Salpingoeca rosetta]|eukprot:XP_004991322.1 hypothetical protein PTSG_07526 [Salpingoeca rosetta]